MHWQPSLAPAGVWTATGLEQQVFVDHSGRRARRVALLGATCAVLAAVWLLALVSGSFGFSTLPAIGLSHAAQAPSPAPHRVLHTAAVHRSLVRSGADFE
ncbi:MAG: hypothetical protein ACR2ND_03440 [Solirubrobacteraceae bacterium]